MSSKLDVRIYYEDTDHGGIVYHANYLKFMERGRTEYLRELGFEQSHLSKNEDTVFALSRTDIHYLRPAYFDDLICVHTEMVKVKGARIYFKQKVVRGDVSLVEGDILVACMSKLGKPKRVPKLLLDFSQKEKA